MSFSLADQTIYFLYSLLYGVLLSALYDIVRVLRFCGINKSWHIVVEDIVYFLVCAVLTFLFALPYNFGGVRYFVLIGESLGFVTYRFTLGEFVAPIYCTIIRVFSKILEKSLKYMAVFLNKLLKANRFVVYNVPVIIHKIQNVVFKKRNKYEHKKQIK